MTQTNSADAFNWKRLKQSNPSALGYFYDRYADKLFAAALHMSKDRDVAKDAVQETFIALWSYRNTLGDIRHSQGRSEEHTSELQSLMRISYAVFCLKTKKNRQV